MSDDRVQRRLAAIVAAEVAGYSRLMRLDEEGTMAAWWSYRRDVVDPIVADHGGRVVKLTGDGFLAEFSSATDAVSAAVAMQSEIASRVADVPEDRRVQFRMGVNLGDILWDDEDIYGDGVNIAARIEGLAEPGGIYVSASIHDQVRHRLSVGFEDMGERELKNIDASVRVFRVSMGSEVTETPAAVKVTSRSRRLSVIAATVVLLVVAAGAALWLKPWEPREEPASVENMAFPLPDKPSIAVLPFTNLSDDRSQEYFADGMTEDLITDLMKISGLFVIARNSSFSYKGQRVKARQVAEELGVRYVLARISQTHLGGVSSGADEPGCGSICVALRQSGPGLIV